MWCVKSSSTTIREGLIRLELFSFGLTIGLDIAIRVGGTPAEMCRVEAKRTIRSETGETVSAI